MAVRIGTPVNCFYNTVSYLNLLCAFCTEQKLLVGFYLAFDQEESVPVEEVNAPGLHRASPAKIHTSQVDIVTFRQNITFTNPVCCLHEI
jgi:hypothetical protein